MKHNTCPSCGSSKVEGFFEIKNAPVYSLVTVKSKEAALNVPRKDIELAFCNDCGFIYNWLYDTSVDYFTQGYEDQQGFSKTFMQYLEGISKDLINKYNLMGKNLIEIGCGKGDFINLITNLNGGKGIGIDPAYEEGRQNNPNLSFIKEFYSAQHGKLPGDLILCRHTLEHIHDTHNFLKTIRDSLGSSTDPVIFFEIPQVMRILDIQAFWDIYYEHCSYFSPGSLARLFRSTGFEVLDLYKTYNDQYVAIEARPVEGKISEKIHPAEESIEELRELVGVFTSNISSQLKELERKLTGFKENNKKAVVWGGGSKSVGFLTNFDHIDLFEYVIDINPHMADNFIPGIGKQYKTPAFLKSYKPDVVVIMNGIYEKEITEQIHQMGIKPEILTL